MSVATSPAEAEAKEWAAGRQPDEPEPEYPTRITRPEGGFLGSYTNYVASLTDAPYIYHVMCGLAALATAAGNSVYLNAWTGLLRLNLWIALIGESGETHKSAAIRPQQRISREAFAERRYPDSFSVEALEATMAKQPAGQLTAPKTPKEGFGFVLPPR